MVLLCQKMCSSMQARKHIGKELLIRCAKAVASRGIPISLASAPTEQLISTCCAFRRAFAALCQKCLACGRIKRIFNGTVAQISKLPLIQNIKVTGIKASVTFYGKIMPTGTGGSAGGRRHSQQDTQIVLKIANADIIASLQLLIPSIKDAAQKTTIKFRR